MHRDDWQDDVRAERHDEQGDTDERDEHAWDQITRAADAAHERMRDGW